MKLYVWRHNRKYHSWSMINEPCVHEAFYTDAIAMIIAETEEQAMEMLATKKHGWRIEDLQALRPRVYDVDEAAVVFEDVRGE